MTSAWDTSLQVSISEDVDPLVMVLNVHLGVGLLKMKCSIQVQQELVAPMLRARVEETEN